MRVKGKLRVEVKTTDNQKLFLTLIVVEGKEPSLLERDWLRHVRGDLQTIHQVKKESKVDLVLHKYRDVFNDDLGELRGVQVKNSCRQ